MTRVINSARKSTMLSHWQACLLSPATLRRLGRATPTSVRIIIIIVVVVDEIGGRSRGGDNRGNFVRTVRADALGGNNGRFGSLMRWQMPRAPPSATSSVCYYITRSNSID